MKLQKKQRINCVRKKESAGYKAYSTTNTKNIFGFL